MSVYVDKPIWSFSRMTTCHMIADSLPELHRMAATIGIKPKWFQNHDPRRPHYDICKSKRALAVAAGAKEIDSRELVKILKEKYG